MALTTNTMAQMALKLLLGKSDTNVLQKGPNNEAVPYSITIASQNLWSDTIPPISDTSVVQGLGTTGNYLDANLIYDVTSNGQAYFACYPVGHPLYGSGTTRIQDAISPSFGIGYEAKPYVGATLIPPGDARDWIFQYQSGVFFQQTPSQSAFGGTTTIPTTIKLYLYIGNKGGTGNADFDSILVSQSGDVITSSGYVLTT